MGTMSAEVGTVNPAEIGAVGPTMGTLSAEVGALIGAVGKTMGTLGGEEGTLNPAEIGAVSQTMGALRAEAGDLNPAENQIYKSFTPPPYTCPLPLKFNPLFEEDKYMAWARDWLMSLNVDKLFTAQQFQNLLNARIPMFSAGITYFAGEWGLKWLMKWTFLLFTFDDVVDILDTGREPSRVLAEIVDFHLVMLSSFPDDTRLREGLASAIKVLKSPSECDQQMKSIDEILRGRTEPGTVYSGKTTIACDVFRDIWADALPKAAPEALLRFAYKAQYWLHGTLLESKYRKVSTIPESTDVYIQIRKRASAVDSMLIGADFLNGLSCPDDWFNSPPMTRMFDAANDFVSWHNDIWSFKKEVLVQKDLFNLVLSIGYHQKIPYQEAAEIATKMMGQRLVDLDKEAADLEKITPPELQNLFLLYWDAARNICSVTMAWHKASPRYVQF